METAKDILRKHVPKWIAQNGLVKIEFQDCASEDQVLSAMIEIADKAWEAATEHADECYCGKCSYCLEVRDDPAPDKSTFMKSLFPDTK